MPSKKSTSSKAKALKDVTSNRKMTSTLKGKKHSSNESYNFSINTKPTDSQFSKRKKMKDLHKTADTILEAIRTIPKSEKFSETAGNWIPLNNLKKHIEKNRKKIKLYINNETFLLAIGILTGSGKIECTQAHGRGVGYFFILREKKHEK